MGPEQLTKRAGRIEVEFLPAIALGMARRDFMASLETPSDRTVLDAPYLCGLAADGDGMDGSQGRGRAEEWLGGRCRAVRGPADGVFHDGNSTSPQDQGLHTDRGDDRRISRLQQVGRQRFVDPDARNGFPGLKDGDQWCRAPPRERPT